MWPTGQTWSNWVVDIDVVIAQTINEPPSAASPSASGHVDDQEFEVRGEAIKVWCCGDAVCSFKTFDFQLTNKKRTSATTGQVLHRVKEGIDVSEVTAEMLERLV